MASGLAVLKTLVVKGTLEQNPSQGGDEDEVSAKERIHPH